MPRPGVAGPVWILFSKSFMGGLAFLFKMYVLIEVGVGGQQERSPIILRFGFPPISRLLEKSSLYFLTKKKVIQKINSQ